MTMMTTTVMARPADAVTTMMTPMSATEPRAATAEAAEGFATAAAVAAHTSAVSTAVSAAALRQRHAALGVPLKFCHGQCLGRSWHSTRKKQSRRRDGTRQQYVSHIALPPLHRCQHPDSGRALVLGFPGPLKRSPPTYLGKGAVTK
jgi:hypothetical protein